LSVHPDPNSIKLFNQLHQYDPELNRWSLLESINEGPSLAAHSALIHSDQMIVFGGLTLDANLSIRKSNDLWLLDLNTLEWQQKSIALPKPNPRYGHSLVPLGDNLVMFQNKLVQMFILFSFLLKENSHNFLLMGGCGGANMKFNDVWLLNELNDEWSWKEITIDPIDALIVPELGFNPVIMVDDMVVMISKSTQTANRTVESYKDAPILRPPIQRPIQSSSSSSGCKLQAQPSTSQRKTEFLRNHFKKPSIRPNARLDREKQLEHLDKMEERLKRMKSSSQSHSNVSKTAKIKLDGSLEAGNNFMAVYVFETSQIFSEGLLKLHQHSVNKRRGPEEIQLYSLCSFHSELVIFGGIKSLKSTGSDCVLNSIFIATPKRTVI